MSVSLAGSGLHPRIPVSVRPASLHPCALHPGICAPCIPVSVRPDIPAPCISASFRVPPVAGRRREECEGVRVRGKLAMMGSGSLVEHEHPGLAALAQ